MMAVCCREWKAPRADAPASVDVRHVCCLTLHHVDPYCVCACGTTTAPAPTCDYVHADGTVPRARWVFIGEAGDFYACDEHYAMRTEEGKRGWQVVP